MAYGASRSPCRPKLRIPVLVADEEYGTEEDLGSAGAQLSAGLRGARDGSGWVGVASAIV
jgi:hypothetical protein